MRTRRVKVEGTHFYHCMSRVIDPPPPTGSGAARRRFVLAEEWLFEEEDGQRVRARRQFE